MYTVDTILSLKEQRPPDEETGEAFPYNEVRVVGESPVSHAQKEGYQGSDAVGVILTPLTNFGSTLDEPFGKLRALYDVKEVPQKVAPAQTQVRVIDATSAEAGPTPEDVFATEAPGVPPEEGQIRGRTSPLGEVRPAGEDGPLGKAPTQEQQRAAAEGARSDSGVPSVTETVVEA